MTMTHDEVAYALAKQVPDLATQAVFDTNYGSLRLDHVDSQKVAALVEKLLRKKLPRAQPNSADCFYCDGNGVQPNGVECPLGCSPSQPDAAASPGAP